MKMLRAIGDFFSRFSKKRHPKMANFDSLSKEERHELLKFEAREFSKNYGELIRTLAKE